MSYKKERYHQGGAPKHGNMTETPHMSLRFLVVANLVFGPDRSQKMTQHPHFLLHAEGPGPGCEAFAASSFSVSSISLGNCCRLRVLKTAVPFLAASRAATTRRTSTVLTVGQNRQQ